ncbi:hypothetical protein FRC15_007585 [Serendipita sp. 397]|nr:hypothetical protein FRC15_007585 [Serendipita sp. 397]
MAIGRTIFAFMAFGSCMLPMASISRVAIILFRILMLNPLGFGAFASPLLGQTLRAHGFRWRSFFWISLSIALCNVFLGLYAFKTTDEEFTIERNLALASDALSQTTKKLGMMKDLQEDDYEKGLKPNKASSSGSKSVWREVMCTPHFWTVAIFLLAYQGAETVAQGFIVTFALHERDANPNKVGYVASGFWAGLALGRIAWGVLSSSFSQRAKIYYMNIALGSSSMVLS